MTTCIMLYSYWRFGRTFWLYLRGSLRRTFLYMSHISLNTEAASFSETSVTHYQSTRNDIPEDCIISQDPFECHKPCVFPSFWSFHQCPFITASEISDNPAHHHYLGFLIRSLSKIGHNQGRSLGGASGDLAPGADFEGAPKKQSPTGHTLIRSIVQVAWWFPHLQMKRVAKDFF
jgi:hypothetical protein